MTRSIVLILALAAPTLAIPPAVRMPMQIEDPGAAVMQDRAANEVQVAFRAKMLLDGDLYFRFDLPERVGQDTTAVQTGLVAGTDLEQSFTVYLPDDGHWRFSVHWQFDPNLETLPDGPEVVSGAEFPIYVTMVCGEVVRVHWYPDPIYQQSYLSDTWPRPDSPRSYGCGADGKPDRMEVEVTVSGEHVEGLSVAFAASISGRSPVYAWRAYTDSAGQASLTIAGLKRASGLYQARVRDDYDWTLGSWHSIPLNRNRRHVLELTLGGGARLLRSEPLTSSKPVASSGLDRMSWGEIKAGVQ